jgi:hypothetical protein
MRAGMLVGDMDAFSLFKENLFTSRASLVSSELKQRSGVDLRSKFSKYISEQESWLDAKLRAIWYDLDSMDSVHFVLGTKQRIEKVRMSPSQVGRLTGPCLLVIVSTHVFAPKTSFRDTVRCALQGLLHLLMRWHIDLFCRSWTHVR